MTSFLSDTERVGAWRISFSLGSFLKTAASVSSDFAVGSRALVFAAAVYYQENVSPAASHSFPKFPSLLHRQTSN